MSTLPPPFDPSDDGDERYRRASELDASRPSEATRRAVLAHAARLAAARGRRAALRRWLSPMRAALRGRLALVGTIAAAILAGVVIAPQFLAPTKPPESERARAAASRQAAAPAAAPAVAPAAAPAVTPAAAPAAPASAPAVSEGVTTLQLEQGARADSARAPAPAAGALAAREARAPVAAASRAREASPPVLAAPEALRRSAATGDLAALAVQLASVSDIDARDGQGRSALMLATLNGQADAVAMLLAHGADPSGADARGTTPLQAAVAADEREIIAMLRRYGAR
ncbi:MAG TPA: ankyrin repeat domain-containing protein [Steroidobacteraceae bacterium]|nr:ankyrin repeat domain-containing protein [Steroidobacteraceae bacterium]